MTDDDIEKRARFLLNGSLNAIREALTEAHAAGRRAGLEEAFRACKQREQKEFAKGGLDYISGAGTVAAELAVDMRNLALQEKPDAE